jgi:hypothetical protein
VHQVTGAQVAITRDHRTAGGDVFERVLSDAVASLKENGAAVEVYSVVRASVSFFPGMPH